MNIAFQQVAVIGAGAMGRGIAQIAAQAGSQVFLYDTQAEASQKALVAVHQVWDSLLAKGRLDSQTVDRYKSQLHTAGQLHDLKNCNLIVEAIVERLDIKKSLFVELENLVSESTVLVTNTSSLSVTAIAAALKRPAQFAGYHFFNPVPLMKVVEVIAGLTTNPDVCARLTEFAKQMGHTPVQANDTPGFIVNHAGRGFGTEALRLLGENVAPPHVIDAEYTELGEHARSDAAAKARADNDDVIIL
jgi:3-hydroxybutyryl-CoA dehydrogenase